MNTPNKLSIVRLCLVPIMMFFYLASFIPYGKIISAVIFIIAAFTDFLDGYIARKHNLVTDLGKFLDPIADKLLNTTGLILIVADNIIPAPYGAIVLVIIIARDLAINMLRQIGASKGKVIAADKLGKYKSVFQYISLPTLMVYANLVNMVSNQTFLTVFMWFGYSVLIVSVIFAILSIIQYLTKNKEVFR